MISDMGYHRSLAVLIDVDSILDIFDERCMIFLCLDGLSTG